ncbi:MAG: helicase-related protein [Treponemataceae bacterium]
MQKNHTMLPVYAQKERILETLSHNQVIVVQSPTGSGKTTQLPIILHEAGFSTTGMIGVTQPRRIAALSVSEFIAKQLNTSYPGLVGYKMRFEDKTDASTKIKIVTDGMLLQELKLDPYLSKYSIVMVDEAHERSLNIDFILGLLKRILQERSDFKVIISSATINAALFSAYFNNCPIVTIDTISHPVAVVYDPLPKVSKMAFANALLTKIESTVERIVANGQLGDILIFLHGERFIKDCMARLSRSSVSRKLFLIPLYGRLAKEEQEKVFLAAPFGKKKVVISTNIAETSVTISGITAVIDSGLAKLNYYSPKNFTSSLIETPVSKASCNQRKGRAGRIQPGICYRLYERTDFETRLLYTEEEIYRTDLSEVVLRMSELGITNFEKFDFISPPKKGDLRSAIETLLMLDALESDNTLSKIGKLMVEFPLAPRQARIIVESIINYPRVIDHVLIGTSFLSAQSPFLLPDGEETDARRAHHRFRSDKGDFVSYLTLFNQYNEIKNKQKFCKQNYLDERVMAEISNIKVQLEQIVSDLGIPLSSDELTNMRSMDNYLCCVSTGMIQFVCKYAGKENYRSLTADNIQIHPGSSMFRSYPQCIVAGEIVRTSRMFAMSVSPLSKEILQKIQPLLEKASVLTKGKKGKSGKEEQKKPLPKNNLKDSNAENTINICGVTFCFEKIKGKKHLILPYNTFFNVAQQLEKMPNASYLKQLAGLRAKMIISHAHQQYELLQGEKFDLVLKAVNHLNLMPVDQNQWPKKINFSKDENLDELITNLSFILRVTPARQKTKELGFLCLFCDDNRTKNNAATYWFKSSRGIQTAIRESLSSLEILIDETETLLNTDQKETLNSAYRLLNSFYQ